MSLPIPDSERTQAATPEQERVSALRSAPELFPDGYEKHEIVGQGGMGIVYRARDVALDRDIAIKVLQPHFAADSAEAKRFVEEARITAQLQHPGIPAIHEVGTMANDRPFIAMKLIKGETLDALLKRPDARRTNFIATFEAIAFALGYAHSRHVIHRDLKPANIMVGAFGEVQVMDWGLAKVLDTHASPQREQGLTTSTETHIRSARDSDSDTRFGDYMGTPAYMPPEQAIGAIDKIDARSDVFGLGAILCTMLTGQPPFNGGSAESTRQLAAQGKLGDAFARLDSCGAEPEWTALAKRCLSAEPADRPANGTEVANEVAKLRAAADERAKQAEIGKARSDTRRRVLTWSAAAVFAVLSAGVGASLLLAKRATDAEQATANQLVLTLAEEKRAREAEATATARTKEVEAERNKVDAAKVEALAKEAEANAVATFFEDKVFAAARPKGQDGGLGVGVTLRDAIAASVPALEKGFAEQPLVEARLRRALGITFLRLAEYERARDQFDRARALFTRHRGPEHSNTLSSMSNLASSYAALGRPADALTLREEVLAIQKRVLSKDHPHTLASMMNLASSYADLNRPADALALCEEVLAIQKRVLPKGHPDTLASMNNLASSFEALNRPADALALREEVPAIMKRVLPPDHPDTLTSMNNLANSYAALNRPADALALFEEVLAIRKRVLPKDHPDTLRSMHNLAISLIQLDRGAEALPLLDEFLAKARTSPAVDPRLIPVALMLRGTQFHKTGDVAGCRATAEMWEKRNHTDALSLYIAARFRAVTAGVQAKTPGADAAKLAKDDADRAMQWLQKAVQAGYKDAAHMKKDTDLDPLREREDFKKLVAELEKKLLPPKKTDPTQPSKKE